MAKVEYKYPNNIVELTQEYIKGCGNEQMELPTVEGLAIELNVNDDTLNEWAKKHDDFGEIFRKLKMVQKVQLINGGMYGGKEINQAMFIFLLKANHNMIETQRNEFIGEGGGPIAINIIGDYLSAPGTDATPVSGTNGQDKVQNTHLAQEGAQNIDSTGKGGTGSTPPAH